MIPRLTPFLARSGARWPCLPHRVAAHAPSQVRATAQQAASSWPLVAWTPIAENPVFTGTGRDTWDRKIRERGYILVGDNGTYDLWYTGYADDRPPTMSLGHATSPDGIRWTRDPATRFSRSPGSRTCASCQRRHVFHVRRGEERHRPPLDLARRPQVDRPRIARHPQDRRHADQPRAIRHPDRLVRERNVVSLLRARRPGRLVGRLEGPEGLDQRAG